MWISRTPEDVEKWHKAAAKEAKGWGMVVGGSVWVILPFLCAGGWFLYFRGGIMAQQVTTGFWKRWLVFAVLAAPFSFWVFLRESKKELAKGLAGTVCPQCDTASQLDAGRPCECGGTFVPYNTVKWTDEPDENQDARPVG